MIDEGVAAVETSAQPVEYLSCRCCGRALMISGELDAFSAGVLASALDAAGLVGDVDVDLTGVTFMDAAGLRVLVGLYEELGRRGSMLRVVGMSPRVRRVLEITGVDRMFTAIETADRRVNGVGFPTPSIAGITAESA